MVRGGALRSGNGEVAPSFVVGRTSFAEDATRKNGFMLQNVARRCVWDFFCYWLLATD